MRQPAQLSFFKRKEFRDFSRSTHGGEIRKGKRKLMRPIDVKRPMHLLLRSEHATKHWSLLSVRHEKAIEKLAYSLAHRFQVRIYRYANAGNHLHLIVKTKTRDGFQRFLKALAGLIARLVTGAKKGKALRERFWSALAFTRVIHWGRDFKRAAGYVELNMLEGIGVVFHSDRKFRARP